MAIATNMPERTCGYFESKVLIVQGKMKSERAGLTGNRQWHPPYLAYLPYMTDHVDGFCKSCIYFLLGKGCRFPASGREELGLKTSSKVGLNLLS
jgi:hypothetical protein